MDKDQGQMGSGGAVARPGTGGMKPAVVIGSVVLVAALAAGGVLFALKTAAPKPVPIGDVLSDMRTYDQQIVTIEGTVGSTIHIPFVDIRAFDISDGSGTITVVTQRGLPEEGTTATVSGQVKQAFKFGPYEKTVILEPAETEK
jgi:hypothetical protein